MNQYIGNESQLYGVEEYSLIGGYKDNVKMLRIYNEAGLEMTVSLDRNADIVSLKYKGKNISYITPNGIRHHSNYEPNGDGWIKHFTAGFLTTCGYQNVGVPCTVDGVDYPLHGSINYIPVDHYSYEITDKEIVVKFVVLDEAIFTRKIKRTRTIVMPLKSTKFSFIDEFENRGGESTPLLVLYHMNIGYPLLKEDSIVNITYDKIEGRNEYSSKYIDTARIMEKPTKNYAERVYFYENNKKMGSAEVISPSEKFALKITYSTEELPCFTEWKMMGVRDYVLGLEPGNVTPEGYKVNKEKKRVISLKPNQHLTYKIDVDVRDI